jgi:hypothetical protein
LTAAAGLGAASPHPAAAKTSATQMRSDGRISWSYREGNQEVPYLSNFQGDAA